MEKRAVVAAEQTPDVEAVLVQKQAAAKDIKADIDRLDDDFTKKLVAAVQLTKPSPSI